MKRTNRKNYNKIMLVFLSDTLIWKESGNPIMKAFYENLNLIDEYPVENFHSLVRRSTALKVTSPETLRRHGINIDYEKHENEFIQNFITDKCYTFVKPKL